MLKGHRIVNYDECYIPEEGLSLLDNLMFGSIINDFDIL